MTREETLAAEDIAEKVAKAVPDGAWAEVRVYGSGFSGGSVRVKIDRRTDANQGAKFEKVDGGDDPADGDKGEGECFAECRTGMCPVERCPPLKDGGGIPADLRAGESMLGYVNRKADRDDMGDATEEKITDKAGRFLRTGAGILGARAKEYDRPDGERSAIAAAKMWNALTGKNMTEAEAWQFLSCLKLVRLATAPGPHDDSATDAAVYAALAGEAKHREAFEKLAFGVNPVWSGGAVPRSEHFDVEAAWVGGPVTMTTGPGGKCVGQTFTSGGKATTGERTTLHNADKWFKFFLDGGQVGALQWNAVTKLALPSRVSIARSGTTPDGVAWSYHRWEESGGTATHSGFQTIDMGDAGRVATGNGGFVFVPGEDGKLREMETVTVAPPDGVAPARLVGMLRELSSAVSAFLTKLDDVSSRPHQTFKPSEWDDFRVLRQMIASAREACKKWSEGSPGNGVTITSIDPAGDRQRAADAKFVFRVATSGMCPDWSDPLVGSTVSAAEWERMTGNLVPGDSLGGSGSSAGNLWWRYTLRNKKGHVGERDASRVRAQVAGFVDRHGGTCAVLNLLARVSWVASAFTKNRSLTAAESEAVRLAHKVAADWNASAATVTTPQPSFRTRCGDPHAGRVGFFVNGDPVTRDAYERLTGSPVVPGVGWAEFEGPTVYDTDPKTLVNDITGPKDSLRGLGAEFLAKMLEGRMGTIPVDSRSKVVKIMKDIIDADRDRHHEQAPPRSQGSGT
jgi:hypothetical protein